MLWSQKPQADHVAGDFIGEKLADAAFDALDCDFFAPVSPLRAKGLHLHQRTLGMKLIEFFFEGQTEQ